MSKKVRDIVIDADHIAFFVAKSNVYKVRLDEPDDDCDDCDWGEEVEQNDDILDRMKEHFKSIVDDYVTTAEVESICYNWDIGKIRVIMSDVTNFRYKLFADYKIKRKDIPHDERMSALKKWAREYYHYEPNTEADDVVAHYVRKGGIGFTTDKDLFNGVEGIWYNSHYMHRSWIRTNKKDAEYFFKQQILAGDGVDGIPSIDGVGLKTAIKLMNKHGSSYKDIVGIFKSKGYTEKYMITMARLVSMTQWSPKKGIRLWNLQNQK